jgi:hypothetical protein
MDEWICVLRGGKWTLMEMVAAAKAAVLPG